MFHCRSFQKNSLTLFIQNMKNDSILLKTEVFEVKYQSNVTAFILTGHDSDRLLSKFN